MLSPIKSVTMKIMLYDLVQWSIYDGSVVLVYDSSSRYLYYFLRCRVIVFSVDTGMTMLCSCLLFAGYELPTTRRLLLAKYYAVYLQRHFKLIITYLFKRQHFQNLIYFFKIYRCTPSF